MYFLRQVWRPILLIVIIATGVGLWLSRDEVLDWLASRGYQPSSQVGAFVSDTTMTPYANRLFYANRPVVETKQAFNKHCTDPSDQVAVLGCFTGDRAGIYIYSVTDERLSGIEQVTAAHEMLHQAYVRLGSKEKARINGLLQQYYDQRASAALRSKIDSYKQTEPGQLLNEMHSIFGTEAPDLQPELETYYKQYFTDRTKILVLHQRYQSEFDNRIAQINSYDTRLAALKTEIETGKQNISQLEEDLRQRRSQLDAWLASNNIASYNAAVAGFNASVVAYRNLVNATNDKVDEFNNLLAERNAIAVQESQLEQAIDSSVDTATRH